MIYFVTSVRLKSNKSKKCDHDEFLLDNRTWGYSKKLKEAKQLVRVNYMDCHEGIYKWIVIEGIEQLWPVSECDVQMFFEWNDKKKNYYKILGWPQELSDYYKNEKLSPILATIG